MERESTRAAVEKYYAASENGYWDYLRGRCHYGYWPKGSKGQFDMTVAQIAMEDLLGSRLNLPKNSAVLDAGCGFGLVTCRLSQHFSYQVTGLDLILRRLVKGKERAGASHNGLINADYHQLPLAPNSFDGVYTMETLVHASDHLQVLREFLRVLKPGGKLVLLEYSIPKLETVPLAGRRLAERVIRNTGMASLPQFTHDSFPQILTAAGYENIKVENISRAVYPSWYYLWKFAARTVIHEMSEGKIGLDYIPGSLWIWPARSWLRYNICEATKPRT